MKQRSNKELWNSSKTKKEAIEFAAGWDVRQKPLYENLLIPYQIKVDKVFSKELLRQKYIDKKQFDAIRDGLSNLEYKTSNLSVEGYEDVHSFVESKLSEEYEDLVGSLHLGLSRNDQICTIMRMLMKEELEKAEKELCDFISTLNSEIKKKGSKVIPGYTHHRIAMPSTYGLLLDSYVKRLERVKKNFANWNKKYNECPLGAAAGFGTSLNIDRERIAKELGFAASTENSLDAVSTRWEAEADLAFSLSMCLTHFSTISQDLIYLSSAGINIFELPSEYCTGSSIMPQKKNPDVLEVIKAKASVVQGIAFSIMSLGRGNISGYNRDTQWTKYLVIDAINEFNETSVILSKIIEGLKVNQARSKKLLKLENAYSAETVIKKSIAKKESYRKMKFSVERKIKKL